MSLSLQLQYARILASLDSLNHFERVRVARELARESEAMQRALDDKVRETLATLRRQGATLEEISEGVGLSVGTLLKLAKPRQA